MANVGTAETRARLAQVLDGLTTKGGLSWLLLDTAAFLHGLAILVVAQLYFILPVPAILQRWDEAYAMAFADRMIAGHDLPYVDAVSQKGPVFYWVVDLAVRLFGEGSWLPMRMLGLACTVLTVALAFAASWISGRTLAGAVMALAYVASTVAAPGEGVGGFLRAFCSEHLANVFAMAALVAMVVAASRRAARGVLLVGLAGALVMLASLSKQVAFTLALPFGLWALSLREPARPGSRRPSAPAAFALGMALPLLAVLARYAVAGELAPLVYYAVTYNSTIFVPAVRGGHLAQYLSDLFGLHVIQLMAGAALGAWVLARQLSVAQRTRDVARLAPSRAFEVTVGLAAVVTLGVALSARRTFPHYYVLPFPLVLPSSAASSSIALASRGHGARPPLRVLLVHAAVLVPLAVLVDVGWTLERETLPTVAGFQEAFKTPAWDICQVVAERTRPTDSIFVWASTRWPTPRAIAARPRDSSSRSSRPASCRCSTIRPTSSARTSSRARARPCSPT